MNRYIVTEQELTEAFGASHSHGQHQTGQIASLCKREAYEKQAKCKSRPVPESATHFSFIMQGYDVFPPEEIPQ